MTKVAMKKITTITFFVISICLSVFYANKFAASSEKIKYSLSYSATKLAFVQQQIDETQGNYVLLAGDSNAELHGSSGRVCDAAIVNAGISGSTTKNYNEFFSKLQFGSHPRAAILTIGTNDLGIKNDPLSRKTSDEFENSISNLILKLKSISEVVLVTDIPPLGHETEGKYDGTAAVEYSRRIHSVCAKLGCRPIDPFADLRDGASGFGLPGANRDGLHLARYKPVLTKIAGNLCS